MASKSFSIFGIFLLGIILISGNIFAQTVTYDSIPSNYQLYPRDKTDNDSAIVTIAGLVADTAQTYDSLTIDIDKDGVLWKHLAQSLSYVNDTASFSLYPKIYADTVEYSFDIMFWNGGSSTQDTLVDSVVCGDVFLISGGSHAQAWVDQSGFTPYQVEWVRTYGTMTDKDGDGDVPDATASDSSWGIAIATEPGEPGGTWHLNIGIIGLRLGKNIVDNYGIPVCVINGAVGGIQFKRHLRDSTNPYNLNTIYGRMLYRVAKAGLINSVSGIMSWHGENDVGSLSNIEDFPNNFRSIRNAWKSDYTTADKIYSTQIPVGGGATSSGNGAPYSNILREYQRTLPSEDPSITEVMTASGIGPFAYQDIYFDSLGYTHMADRYFWQIRRDFYGYSDLLIDIDPPNISQAYFTDAQKDTLVLEFSNADTVFWQNDTIINSVKRYMKDYFYFHHTGGGVDSLVVDSGFVWNQDNIKLVLKSPSNADSISYLPSSYYNGTTTLYEGPWLKNSKGIPALAFHAFLIDSSFGDVNTGPPVLNTITDQNMNEGGTLDVGVSSTDPDGDEITLTVNNLPSFGSFTDSGNGAGNLHFTPAFGDTGDYANIQIIAIDDGNPSKSDTISFKLTVADSNRAPVLNSVSSQSVNEDDTLNVGITSTDADGDNITLTTNSLPAFGSLTDNGNGTGTIQFTPGFDDAGVYSNIKVIATDDGSPSSKSDTVSFTLTVDNVNRNPVLTSIAAQGVNEGDTLGVAVSSTDPDGNSITLTTNNLPSFGSLTDNGDGTGSLSFSPGFEDAGVYSNIKVIATDNGSPALTDTVAFTLTVSDVNRAPVLNAIAAQNVNENDTLDVAVSSTDADGNTITLTTNNLPSFSSFTDNGDGTGSFRFTPGFGNAGFYSNIEVVATDNGSPTLADTVSFNLTVSDVNRAPVLTAISAQSMNENESLAVGVSSTDPDGHSITLTTNNLPSFGSLTDNGNGTGTINFTAGFNDAGVYSNIEVIATDNGSPSLADTTSFTLTVNNVNRAPVISSIADQGVNEGEVLNVGVTSTDPDGNNITLAVNNLPSFGSLTDNGDGTGSFSFSPGFEDAGVYTNIEVIATDNGSPTLADTIWFALTVNDVNRAPVLTPMASLGMNEGNTLDIGVSATDADGNSITLTTSNVPSFGSFTDNGDGTGSFHFTPGFGDAGVYANITVFATDNGSPSLADTGSFTLTVNNVNRTPVLTAISAQNMNENETLAVGISSTDPDGDIITLTTNNLPAFGSLTDNGDGTGTINFTAGFDDAGVYTNIEVIATDNGSPAMDDTVSFTLTVNNVNRAPLLSSIADQNMNEGDILNVGVTSTDPDGNNMTLTVNNLPSFGNFTDNGDGTGSLTFDPGYSNAGTYPNIEVISTDNGSPSLADTVSFALTVIELNRAPVLNPLSSLGMHEGTTLNIGVTSTDADGDSIILTSNNLPSFGSLTDNGDGTGTISFSPDFGDAGVYNNIEIIATDNGSPSKADTVSFTLTVDDINRAPVLATIAAQGVNEGDTLEVTITSTDADGDNIVLTTNNLPTFGSFTDNGNGTGSLRFTPGYDDAGVYPNIEVIATDNGNPSLADTVSFTLTVSDVNRTPVLTSISSQSVNEGDTLDVSVSSTDPDGNSITLTANNLPSFGSLTDNGDGTGSFSFKPSFGDVGVYSDIQVIATDNGTPSLSDTVSFILSVGNVNRAPVITPIADQNMNEGSTLNVAVSSTDLDGDNITLAVNNLPSFGSFTDNGDGTGSFQFIPDFTDAGDYLNIEVTATDDGSPSLAATVSFTLTVNNVNRAPVLTSISPQNTNEGEILEVNVSSTDPDGDNITLKTNNIPSFGSFTNNGDGTGRFRFTPGYDDTGIYPNLEVIATDNGNPSMSDTVTFTLTVNDVNRAPVLTSIGNLTINEGEILVVPVSANDQDGDNLVLTANNLPSFSSFTDNGDGTGSFRFPAGFNDAGVYSNIQVIATDTGTPSLSDTVSFTLTVNNVNRAPVLASVAHQSMNEGDTLDVAVSSTDPDGNSITLTAINVPPFGSFTDNGDGTGSFRFIANFGDTGVYPDIEVIATDNGSPSLSDTVSFSLAVGDVNRAPILTHIPAQGMNENDTLQVSISSIDPDGDNITLITNNLPSFASLTDSGNGSGSISFITGYNAAGVYSNISVIAIDDANPSLSDTVIFSLTVTEVNRTPVLTSITDQVVNENDILNVGVSSTDPDGNNITLTVNNLPSFGSLTDNGDGTGTISFNTGFDDAGVYAGIVVIATDNGSPSLSDTVSFTMTVNNVNRAPVLTSIASQSMNENDTLGVGVSSTDPDGNNITLTANNVPSFGSFIDNGDGTGSFQFNTDFGDAGVYPNITVIAIDNGTPSLSDTVSFTLTVGDINRAPILTAIADQGMNEGDTLHVGVTSTDPDGNNITLTTNSLPSFGNLTDNGDGTGTISFAAGFGDAGIYPNIEVIATDNGSPLLSDTISFTLTVDDVNRAPVLTSIVSQGMNEGDTLDVAVSSTDPDGNNITLTTNNLPSFGNLTDNGDGTGTISFAAGFEDAGVYPNLKVIATDNGNPSMADTATFTLTVINTNRLPLAVDDADTTAEDTTITINVLANDSDPDNDILAIMSTTQGSNGTVNINPDSTLSYTPKANFYGTDMFTYIASDGNGGIDSATVTLTVTSVNDLPVISNLPDSVSFNADSSVTLNVWDNVTDVETPDSLLIYQFFANPDSLTFDYNSTSGVLTITSAPNFTGEIMATIVVSDPDGGNVRDSLLVIVHPPTGIFDPLFGQIPQEYVLFQNFPNPFNPVTHIKYGLPKAGKVQIMIYNVLGQQILKLLDAHKPAGYHVLDLNAGNLPSGIYFYRIQTDHYSDVKKMVLLR